MTYTYDLSALTTALLVAVVVWDAVWRGFALWRAARQNQRVWFVLMMIINSVGLLPIIYLLTHRPTTYTAPQRGNV